jgi:general stress protein 26
MLALRCTLDNVLETRLSPSFLRTIPAKKPRTECCCQFVNGDVSYDGTSYYFTYEQARAVADIQRNPKVALGFSSEGGIFSGGIYVAVKGTTELIRDKATFQQHWTSDLDNWFENCVNTPGIVLIMVKAKRATYWKGREEGEVEL